MKKAILDITLDNAMDILQEIEDKSNLKWCMNVLPTKIYPFVVNKNKGKKLLLIENDYLVHGSYESFKDKTCIVQTVDDFISCAGQQTKERQPQTTDKDFPHVCTNCGAPAYIGLLSTDCSKNCT